MSANCLPTTFRNLVANWLWNQYLIQWNQYLIQLECKLPSVTIIFKKVHRSNSTYKKQLISFHLQRMQIYTSWTGNFNQRKSGLWKFVKDNSQEVYHAQFTMSCKYKIALKSEKPIVSTEQQLHLLKNSVKNRKYERTLIPTWLSKRPGSIPRIGHLVIGACLLILK